MKALNNLVKNKYLVIQKANEGNNIVILNRSDYSSKLSKILEDTPKFKRVSIEERKTNMSHPKFRRSRRNFWKRKNVLHPSGSKPRVFCVSLPKSIRH